jgi:hypothetical protein
MIYAMVETEGVCTRYGRMCKSKDAAIRLAKKCGGYVEKYLRGVVWTPLVH